VALRRGGARDTVAPAMILDELERLRLDWANLDEASRVTREVTQALASDKAALRELVHGIERRPALLARCEHHRLLDKLVVYDALDRGFRIRVHLSTDEHLDRPHDHRFSFSTRILTGRYRHVKHRLLGHIDEAKGASAQNDFEAVPSDARVVPWMITNQERGSFYTLHHAEIHTTVTTANTVSLFIRGPAEKDRSIITDRETGKLWWRYGEESESAERRRQKVISVEQYRALRDKLAALQVI
jgi:hypothetical protein